MKANKTFSNLGKSFWGTVKSVSQQIGYSKKGRVFVPNVEDLVKAFEDLNLDVNKIQRGEVNTDLCRNLISYFQYRAECLNNYVEPRLMNVERAKEEFNRLNKNFVGDCPLPMNKQKGDKKAHAYFTGIINMIISNNLHKMDCDFDPKKLTTVTKNGVPIRTLSRRVDGAFPSVVNPYAIWEIKEYYYTTTFGSRIADGVYETLLDGMELEELNSSEGIKIQHLFMIDSHTTWWLMGKSYLCRIIDMLHMGYIDEVLFGYEVVEKLPGILSNWQKDIK
tara:strand:+ start:1033 stop:1866 length:834 start_codon:yes stop_codon:yes gene_type:complete